MKRILIISYTFPPYPGIGGRRWAKFAKYLTRSGNKVCVISAKNPFDNVSSWMDDVQGIEQHQLPADYPLSLYTFPKTLLGRISYRLDLLKVKFLTKGNYYDKTIFWKKRLQKKCIELIEKYDIKNIVCTVAPFNMAQAVIELKDKFPDVKFILDYRDPWTNNEIGYGITSISQKRLTYEKGIEKYSLEKYDIIIGVALHFVDYFNELTKRKDFESKYLTLPNGYDIEDLEKIKKIDIPKIEARDILIVYAGTFYDKSIHILKKLIANLQLLIDEGQINNNLKFIFLGTISQEGLALINSNPSFVWLGNKTLQESNYVISRADYCSLFLTDDLDYSFSTKFYEYLSQNKRILTFSKAHGYNAQYIEDNKIGYGFNFENMKEKLIQISQNGRPEKIGQKDFDITKFDVKNLTLELEKLLK